MSDPIETITAVASAIGALKLKLHQLVSTREGIEIRQLGKPTLLLTHAAAVEGVGDAP